MAPQPNPTNKNPVSNPAQAGPKTLVGLLGVLAASILMTYTPRDEGTEYKAYRDIVGVWTICNGDTKDVQPGLVETPEGCKKRLEKQLIAHSEPVLKCTPSLADPARGYQLAMAADTSYNAGPGNWCTSSMDREFDAGNWVAGCNALLRWNRATFNKPRPGSDCIRRKDGRWSCVVRGLDLRRKRWRQICLTNLLPGYTPENLAKRVGGAF